MRLILKEKEIIKQITWKGEKAKLLTCIYLQNKLDAHKERLEINKLSQHDLYNWCAKTPIPEAHLIVLIFFMLKQKKKTLQLKPEKFFQREAYYLITKMTKDLAPNRVQL